MSERAAVYRLFECGVLLYVGVAKSFGRRWEQHAQSQPWWPEVSRQTVEWHPDRETALAVEKAAIKAEKPRHNVMHTPRASGPRELAVKPLSETASAELKQLRELARERRLVSAEIDEVTEALLRDGEFLGDVADALGESPETVRRFHKDRGIPDAREIRRAKGTAPRRRTS